MNRDLPIFLAVVVVVLASLFELPLSTTARAENRVAGVTGSVEAGKGQADVAVGSRVHRHGNPTSASKSMPATSAVAQERAD